MDSRSSGASRSWWRPSLTGSSAGTGRLAGITLGIGTSSLYDMVPYHYPCAAAKVPSMSYRSVFRPGLFDGQVVLVTGGIAGREANKLEKVRAELAAGPGKVTCHPCDIRDEAQVIAMIDSVLAAHGRIDGLVNNAGGQYRQPLSKISSKGFEAVVRLNL